MNEDKVKPELGAVLEEISNIFIEAMKDLEKEQEDYWNSLSHDDQLKAFCAVVRRIHKGEIEAKGSYRYVLYDVFGFGPEAYAMAQDAGYLTLHNSIFSPDQERKMYEDFAKFHGLGEEAVSEYYIKRYL